MATKYTAHVRRDGRWWMVEVPQIDGLTQARRLGEAGLMARELVAITLDIPVDEVEVEVVVSTIGDVDVMAALERIEEKRAEAARIERQATDGTRALASALRGEGVALRDIGTVLGVSHQRVDQILKA